LMRLIVLAGGAGTRINKDGIRKGLIDAGDGRPLMFHAARNAQDFIDEVWIITGKYNCTYDAAYDHLPSVSTRRIRNPFWSMAGNFVSLWTALLAGAGDKPYIIMNSDTVVSQGGLSRLLTKAMDLGEAAGIFETMKKPLTKHDYAGVACVVSEEARAKVAERVEELMRACSTGQAKWEAFGHWDVFFRDRGEKKTEQDQHCFPGHSSAKSFGEIAVPLSIHEISEIDTMEDLAEHYRLLAAGMKDGVVRRDSE